MLCPSALAALSLLALSLACGVAHPQETSPTTSAPTSVLKAYDLKAEALLRRADVIMKAAESFSGKMQTIVAYPTMGGRPTQKERYVVTFTLQKPNLLHNETVISGQGPAGEWTVRETLQLLSDGKRLLFVTPASKSYVEMPLTKANLSRDVGYLGFFGVSLPTTPSPAQLARSMKAKGLLVSLSMAPDANWGGVPCSVVEMKYPIRYASLKATKSSSVMALIRYYVGKKDGVVRGNHREVPSPDGGETVPSDEIITDVVIGKKLPASAFALNVAGYKEAVGPQAPPRPVH